MAEKQLKPGWRRVKFGDVVCLSKARSQNPLADGLESYVRLDARGRGAVRESVQRYPAVLLSDPSIDGHNDT